jgi:hypothetical protein
MRSYTLPIAGNLFEELLASVRFEDVGKGRQGAVLTKIDETGNIPIVRTTTRYSAPAQRFQSVHDRLAHRRSLFSPATNILRAQTRRGSYSSN